MDLESRLRLQASALAPSFCQLAILATFLRLLLLLCVCVSHSVASDSLQPHRFLCPLQPLQQPGSSVRGILQARILQEWVSIFFSRGSPQSKDRTRVSLTAGRRFTIWAKWTGTYIQIVLSYKKEQQWLIVETWLALETVIQNEVSHRKTNTIY